MVKVKVINHLEKEKIDLKEGVAGNYRKIKTIDPKRFHVMKFDANATYREFPCVESTTGLKLILTSNDLVEFEEVRITGYTEDNASLVWDTKRRNQGGVSALVSDRNINAGVETVGNTFSKVCKGILSVFTGKKKNQKDVQAKAKVLKSESELEMAKSEAEKAKSEGEKAEAENVKSEAEKAKSEAEKAKSDAEKANVEAKDLKAQLVKAEAKAPAQVQAGVEASNGQVDGVKI